MTRIDQKRLAAFHRRFPGREEVPLDSLYARCFAGEELPRDEVEEVIALLAEELALPAELLRPEDKMADLLEPLHSGSPLRWIGEWTRAADGKAELNDQVRRRLEAHGTLDAWTDLSTVGDLVRAWCGRLPAQGT